MGGIRILNGKYKGAEIVLIPGRELVIGRDVHQCQFVIESAWVSRVHVRIMYNEQNECYMITDESKHGTYDSDNRRLPNGETVIYERNSMLSIGKEGISIFLM